MMAAGAVDCLQVDVTRCGGITDWLRAAAVPNLRHLEYVHDHVRIENMLFDGALDPHGRVLRPDRERPGLGLVVKHADAEQFRVP
jgi:hypothetical protein